jgi:hypothetical protein
MGAVAEWKAAVTDLGGCGGLGEVGVAEDVAEEAGQPALDASAGFVEIGAGAVATVFAPEGLGDGPEPADLVADAAAGRDGVFHGIGLAGCGEGGDALEEFGGEQAALDAERGEGRLDAGLANVGGLRGADAEGVHQAGSRTKMPMTSAGRQASTVGRMPRAAEASRTRRWSASRASARPRARSSMEGMARGRSSRLSVTS